MSKLIFCANCQTEKPHNVDVQPREVIATCECGRHIKFPALKNAGALRAMFDEHRTVNTGQVPAVEYVPDTDVVSAIENA